ncbi:alpha/beta fold hydrolase [Mucilaginibacter polytrichastri]|nr:alpha/beta hydrolase [Mucilaginibacter polytrichastri]SFS82223.1 Tat (twin-arginine translocation) pathway signal sequence [Mucilaginibacter polytrichastri]
MERRNFLKQGSIAAAGLALLNSVPVIAEAAVAHPYNASNVPTKYVEANGVKFAYRRLGKKAGLPLVCTNYLTGTMDNWDPAVINALAKDREVIIFDNRGVSGSSGETPDTIAAMAKDAGAFVDALGLKKIDLWGFSIGGMVAQQFTLDRPELIRRLILVGTGPRGGEGMQDYSSEVWEMLKKKHDQPDELLLDTFFIPTEESQKAGWAYLKRIRARTAKDPLLTEKVVPAQLAAIFGWGKMYDNKFEYLKEIKQPVFIGHGDHDVILPVVNAFNMKMHIPNAQLVIYPNANHSPQNQEPELFVRHITLFLDSVV